MAQGFKIVATGPRACFTRPELKSERVSYEVITPSAARGILEAIYWKPQIRWVIDRIHVLKPIRFESMLRNELKSRIGTNGPRQGATGTLAPHEVACDAGKNRTPRSTLALRNVSYGIEAHFELTDKETDPNAAAKHASIIHRRLARGQHFHQPCLGLREFAADVEPVESFPASEAPDLSMTLGVMLYDIDYVKRSPIFYRPTIEDGVIDVAAARGEGLLR